jgi:hypothetical protein
VWTAELVAHQAACDCGWRGQHHYAPTEHGENLAYEEWDRDHLRPLLDAEARKHTVSAETLLALVRDVRGSLHETVDDQGHSALTQRGVGQIDVVERLEHLLDDLHRTRQGFDEEAS